MKKRIIVLLSAAAVAAVIITAAAFFVFNNRASTSSVNETTVSVETIDYLALETDEVIRIKKMGISGFYNDTEPEIQAVVIVPAEKPDKSVKKPEQVQIVEKVKPVEVIPKVAVVEKIESDIEEKAEELPDEKSDIFTDKELFVVETPKDRSFYRKKVFVSGKILDTEISSFTWKTEEGEKQVVETDYAGEFGFYIKTEEMSENLKIYMTAVKDDGNKHEKLMVLFNKNVKPEISIKRPVENYKFGRYLTVEGQITIPGHDRYIGELVKEAFISLSPAGVEEALELKRNGEFRHIIKTGNDNIAAVQKMSVNVSLNNYKSSSETVVITKSDYDLVDYKITASDQAITINWDDLPVKADYNINLISKGSEKQVIENVKSPVKISNLINRRIYDIQLEAVTTQVVDMDIKPELESEHKTEIETIQPKEGDIPETELKIPENDKITEHVEVLKSKNEKVLPLDPESIKPAADGIFGRIKLKWPLIKAAGKYDLYRKSVRGGEEIPVLTNFTGNSYTDENVTPADTYSYSVEPHGLISVRSSEESVKPSTGERNKLHEIKQLEDSEKIRNIFIVNNYAYLITENGIIISDITDFNNPVFAGSIDQNADYLSVDEEYCYTVSKETGLTIYDISDPSDPKKIARREQYKGDFIWSDFPYLYINEKYKGIRILNVEQPDMPEKVRLHSGLSFKENPVILHNEELLLTAFDNSGKVSVFKIISDGKIINRYELETDLKIMKAQSSFVKDSLITAVLTDERKIFLFETDAENNSSVKHLIDNINTVDFNFFTAHDGRSFIAVYKENNIDFYSVDISGEASLFTSVKKNNGETISVCHDSSGYAYMVKSGKDLKLYRMMTEGVSYINNSYKYPDKVHDFKIGEKYILALTDSGIYYSEKKKYFPEPVLLSKGSFKAVWKNKNYTTAIDNDYNYVIYTDYEKDPLKVDNEGIEGRKTSHAGDYSVILNQYGEVLIFSYDITKNAPNLHASISREKVRGIFAFSDAVSDYTGVVTSDKIELFRIDKETGVVPVSEIAVEKAYKVKCSNNGDSSDIDIYTDGYIKRISFAGTEAKEIFTEENADDNISIYGSLIVKSDGEKGISIYKDINGRRILVSRCSGIFSFDTQYSDGKLYSRGFNAVEEIVPVIPDWFK